MARLTEVIELKPILLFVNLEYDRWVALDQIRSIQNPKSAGCAVWIKGEEDPIYTENPWQEIMETARPAEEIGIPIKG